MAALSSLGCGTVLGIHDIEPPDDADVTNDATGDGADVPGDGGAVMSSDAGPTTERDASADAPSYTLVMTCGTASCDLSASVCCTCAGCTLPFPTGCFPLATGCVPAGTYATLTCGGADNCALHSRCCAALANSVVTGSSCQPSCASGDLQLCATDAECAGNRTCAPLPSLAGFTACQ